MKLTFMPRLEESCNDFGDPLTFQLAHKFNCIQYSGLL